MTKIAGKLKFTTEITASVNDTLKFQGDYWSRALIHWSFDGDGTVKFEPAAMGKGPSWPWKSKGAAVSPPSGWELRDAPSKVDTSGDVGNAVIRQYEFYDPDVKKKP
jgi:hypothetical protein